MRWLVGRLRAVKARVWAATPWLVADQRINIQHTCLASNSFLSGGLGLAVSLGFAVLHALCHHGLLPGAGTRGTQRLCTLTLECRLLTDPDGIWLAAVTSQGLWSRGADLCLTGFLSPG